MLNLFLSEFHSIQTIGQLIVSYLSQNSSDVTMFLTMFMGKRGGDFSEVISQHNPVNLL